MSREGQAVRAMAYVGWVAVCLGLAGCSLFGRRSAAPGAAARAPAGGGSAPADVASRSPAPPPGVNGILAGRVVDSYNRQPPATFIRVVAGDQPSDPKSAPIEVAADAQGYFTIQGLRPGVHYQLIARAKEGDRLLAGTTWVTPPDPRVLISISEDLATENVPPIPAAPIMPGPKSAVPQAPAPQWPDKPAPANDAGSAANPADARTNAIPPRRAAEIGPPRPAAPDPNQATTVTPPPARPPVRPEDIVQDPRSLAQRSPTVSVPPQAPRPITPAPAPAPGPLAGPAATPAPAVPTRVPSCVLTGRQLTNFALYDLNGQPWEYRNHQGRVVLLDFWGTWCPHCVQSIPTLNVLQERYGPSGLEVIGIAYEEGKPQQQLEKVLRVCSYKRINYRVLMGSDMETCPVKSQFGVNNFPALVLLDSTGKIVWRSEGLDRDKLQELESQLQRYLNVR